MNSFTSQHYPLSSKNKRQIVNDTSMYYYAVLLSIVLILVILRFHSLQYQIDTTLIVSGILGLFLSLFLGNRLAIVKLNKTYAQIFFVGEDISLLSVYDILYQQEKQAFPLRFTNHIRMGDEIIFHFKDQIIHLKKEDWNEFELIWECFCSYNSNTAINSGLV